ncbi:MAG: hypothetical protein R3F23_06205 [Verrucomicrobiia bacterium]
MSEPTVSNPKLTPEQQKTYEAFLEIFKEIDNEVKKVKDHPLVKGLTSPTSTEGCRTSVELQSHEVAFDWEHTSIRITPKDEKYKDDPRFMQGLMKMANICYDELGHHLSFIWLS